jgi:hypothetical protein
MSPNFLWHSNALTDLLPPHSGEARPVDCSESGSASLLGIIEPSTRSSFASYLKISVTILFYIFAVFI